VKLGALVHRCQTWAIRSVISLANEGHGMSISISCKLSLADLALCTQLVRVTSLFFNKNAGPRWRQRSLNKRRGHHQGRKDDDCKERCHSDIQAKGNSAPLQ